MLIQSLVAWLVFPGVLFLLATGLGLGLDRLSGSRLPAPLIPVSGMAAGIVLALAVFRVGGTGPVAAAVLLAGAVAGAALDRGRWVPLRRPAGAIGLAGLGAYGLHLAPVVLSGGWTWAGYNFVNDTAIQMLLAGHLAGEGTGVVPAAGVSTTAEAIRGYLLTAYPLGSHSLLAAVHELVPVPLAAVYQPYIGSLAATAALSLAVLACGAGLSARWGAVAGFAAAGANLFYQYALQGNVKEIAFVAVLAGAAALGRELVVSERRLALALPLAVCVAAAISIYSAAAGPYLAALAVALAAGVVLRSGPRGLVRLLPPGAVAVGLSLVLAIPALLSLSAFQRVASGTFASPSSAGALGQLVAPLKLAQAAGVWLTGDYRYPVTGVRGTITAVLCILVVVLAVAGLLAALRRREPGPLALLFPAVVVLPLLLPRLAPYADGKVLALASPALVLAAGIGAWALARHWVAAGAVAGALVLLGVLWSDALAYHAVKLAPVGRMEALRDVGRRFAGTRGLVLLNEPEEFAKVFMPPAPMNTAAEAVTPRQVQLRQPQTFQNLWFDLDDELLSYVEEFPAIVLRRSPAASRPPANYRRVYGNDWYEGWVRVPGVRVLEHLPLQQVHLATARPDCREVRAMARRVRQGEMLVAAWRPRVPMLDTAVSPHSPGWLPHPWQPRMVVTTTPGRAAAPVEVPAGRYRGWIAGSFGRPIEARVDGHPIGQAVGVNNVGQWLPAGTVALRGGRHRLELVRGPGGLAPGDGYKGDLGPLALERTDIRPRLLTRSPARWRSLCGRQLDWIERVQR